MPCKIDLNGIGSKFGIFNVRLWQIYWYDKGLWIDWFEKTWIRVKYVVLSFSPEATRNCHRRDAVVSLVPWACQIAPDEDLTCNLGPPGSILEQKRCIYAYNPKTIDNPVHCQTYTFVSFNVIVSPPKKHWCPRVVKMPTLSLLAVPRLF